MPLSCAETGQTVSNGRYLSTNTLTIIMQAMHGADKQVIPHRAQAQPGSPVHTPVFRNRDAFTGAVNHQVHIQ